MSAKIPVNYTGKCHHQKSRFVCISDTHAKTDFVVPDGDVLSKLFMLNVLYHLCLIWLLPLVHAGDITRKSTFQEFAQTIQWLSTLPHR